MSTQYGLVLGELKQVTQYGAFTPDLSEDNLMELVQEDTTSLFESAYEQACLNGYKDGVEAYGFLNRYQMGCQLFIKML